jgi:PucR family transcriptional regulator, purine catabolism regulatory protein
MYRSTTTIEDIYRLALPAGSRLLTGEEYFSRAVSWACSLRPSPPAFPKLDGNELALIDMDDLRRLDAQMRLDRVVFSLQSARVSAIAVLGQVDESAIRAAQSTQLSLIGLPGGESLIPIERAVIRLIVDRAGYIAQRSAELQRELNQVAMEGGGLTLIAEHVRTFAQQPVLLLREDGTLGTVAGLDHLSDGRRRSLLGQLPNVHELRTRVAQQNGGGRGMLVKLAEQTNGDYGQAVVLPIIANDQVRGYCLLLRPTVGASDLSAVEEIASSQCAAAAALEWAKQHAVDVAADSMRAAFVDELLAAEIADEQAWIQRGASLGFDLSRPHVAWLIEARGIPEWPIPLMRFVSERHVHVPSSRRQEGMLLFWPTDDPKSGRDLKGVAADMVTLFQAQYPRCRVQIGIGRPAAGPARWLQSQQQARESWRLGKEWKGAPITYFGDLGLYQLLTALGTNPEAARFYRKTLGKLVAFDKEKNAELVDTLDAFYACHGNLSQTAARLHIHRNTLTYRLSQISSVAQVDLEDPDARFSLQLALKLRPVLRNP